MRVLLASPRGFCAGVNMAIEALEEPPPRTIRRAARAPLLRVAHSRFGRALAELSRHHQVVCITHLPQIASFADVHQIIFKKLAGGRTTTSVQKLDSPEDRAEEVARMLGGTTITTKTREHAREMLKRAQGIA